MAADSRSRGRVPYRLLHNLSTVDLVYDDSKGRKKKRKTIGVFEAERVVARKKKSRGIYPLYHWQDTIDIKCVIENLKFSTRTLCIYCRESTTLLIGKVTAVLKTHGSRKSTLHRLL